MVKFKVGDRVKAKSSCCNDFEGGKGIIEKICTIYNRREVAIKVTKSTKSYRKGETTTCSNWEEDIELIVDPNDLDDGGNPNG